MGGSLCHAPEIVAVIPWKEHLDCIKDKDLHSKLRARLLDFSMYNCKWKVGKNVW